MRVSSTVLVTAGATALTASAQQHPYGGYIQEVCMPLNSSNLPDMNAPCNALEAIEAQCLYGPEAGLQIFYASFNTTSSGNDDDDDDDDVPPEQDNRAQQICVCESQFFDLLEGCTACYKAHGSGELEAFLGTPSFVASAASSYCAATATPSVDLANFLDGLAQPSDVPPSVHSELTATSSFSDPIGNKTAVSYYFTPSATGSPAWIVAEPTAVATSSSGSSTVVVVSFSSLATSGGMLVPTLAADAASSASGSTPSGSTTSTHNGGARETAAVMGVMGLLGVAAML